MNASTKPNFDITVTQQGDIYKVTGKDAPKLHAKLETIPEEERTLVPDELKDGAFTFRKASASASASA